MESSSSESWDVDDRKTSGEEPIGWNNLTQDKTDANCSLENRRGRPKAASLTNLMREGAKSRSSIKCSYCARVFPREKSLQAHQRIHTGELFHANHF